MILFDFVQEEMTTVECSIDHRVHPRIIGQKGRNVRRIMEKYKVDIRFPRQTDNDPDIILISGDEDNCIDCREELLNLEEEYVSDSVLDASNFDPNVYVIFLGATVHFLK